jgi:hypothetical protein
LHGSLQSRFGRDVVLKRIEPKRGLLTLPRIGLAAGLSADLAATVEDRAVWARLGL